MAERQDVSTSIQRLRDVTTAVSADPSMKFVLRESEFQVDSSANSTLLKRLLLYAPRTVLVTPEARYITPVGDYNPAATTNWTSIPHSLLLTTDEIAALKLAGAACVHLPERVIEQREKPGDNDEFYADGENTVFRITDHWTMNDALTVHLNDAFLRRQLTERTQISHPSVVNLRLPILSNITISDLIQVRRDEFDSFSIMHDALRKFVTGLGNADSDTKIKALLEEVDFQVRKTDQRFKEITGRSRTALAEVAVGVSVIGICMLIPSVSQRHCWHLLVPTRPRSL